MTLSLAELFEKEQFDGSSGQVHVQGLTSDSRQVKPGMIFAALTGNNIDGTRFIPDAIASGAIAILCAQDAQLRDDFSIPIIRDQQPRRRLAELAARYYAQQPRHIAAVTGTSGKTSVTVFMQQIWSFLGLKSAALGTMGIVTDEGTNTDTLTTPDPVTLHQLLLNLSNSGTEHLAMEASSHGLDQHRLDGVRLHTAGFTNLGRDHLDYHSDMEAYFKAKSRLFSERLPVEGTAVICTDDSYGRKMAELCRHRNLTLITCGSAEDADLRLLTKQDPAHGQDLELSYKGQTYRTHLPLLGAFQAANAILSAAMVHACGAEMSAVIEVLPKLTGVAGRFQYIGATANGASVFVDYAHKPEALRSVLQTARSITKNRLIVVFGAGGNRDKGKRRLMGEIASELADIVVITDDNPRFEDPTQIRSEILAAAPSATEIGGRRAAIEFAIEQLNEGDILIVAGKGHESGQYVNGDVIAFSDQNVIRTSLEKQRFSP